MRIVSGRILLYRLYDVSWETDLAMAEARAEGSSRMRIDRKQFSRAFEFSNPPVSIGLGGFDRTVDGVARRVNCYAKLYDYGVLSVIFEIPISDMTFGELASMAGVIRDVPPLEDDFAATRDRICQGFSDAMKGAGARGVEEGYTIYYIAAMDPPMDNPRILTGQDLSGLMLQEQGQPEPGEAPIRELEAMSFSYSNEDLTVISWDNALVVDPGGSMDIPDLLEFAHAQLLELRVYDQALDRELDAIYAAMSSSARRPLWRVKRHRDLAGKVLRTVTELTEITEKIDNSLKVTDDVYYARLYTAALELFRVKTWDTNIRRKLDLAQRVYTMLYQEISTSRSEILEIIIILLIALEIVIFLYLEF